MKSLAIIPLGLGIMLAAIPARADNTSCTGSLSGQTINGNLVVPDGASCRIGDNVSVTGNVLVGTGAFLRVPGGNVTISGNLQANRCKTVAIEPQGPVSVGGSVAIHSCTPQANQLLGYFALDASVTIAGSFLCQSNSGPCTALRGSIGDNATISQNTGGTSNVSGNTIGGNLLCFGNTSVAGGSDTVGGKKLGQCAGL
jgi:predicted acyltransferase (DUF342 family)